MTHSQNRETVRLAEAFADAIWHEIGADNYAEVFRRNLAETDSCVCHSHDFCDPNQVMLDAFELAFGREAEFSGDGEGDDMPTVRAAWQLWDPRGK